MTDACAGPDGKPGTLWGHTGASFGTMSFSFTSLTGERQVTLAYSGRDYTEAVPPINDFLVAGLTATCTTKTVNPAPRSGGPEGGVEVGHGAGAYAAVPDLAGMATPRR